MTTTNETIPNPGEPMRKDVRAMLLLFLLVSNVLLIYCVYSVLDAQPPNTASTTGNDSPATGSQTVVEQRQEDGEAERTESAENEPEDKEPRLDRLDPDSAVIGLTRGNIRIFGEDFTRESIVRFDGDSRTPRFVSSSLLVLQLASSDLSAPGAAYITVVNGEAASEPRRLVIKSASEVVFEWRFFRKGTKIEITQELKLLLLVVFTGALGATIAALQSLADYRGGNRLAASWTMFYLVRPAIGGGIAFVFYVVVRGGFLAGTTIDAESATPYGIVALSALVGMFSDKAALKLNEVFTSLLKSNDSRGDKLGGLKIDTKALLSAKVGEPYKQELKASLGKPPYKWTAVSALPKALTLNVETGELHGTPTDAAPKARLEFVVTDAEGTTATAAFDLEIVAASIPAGNTL